MLDSLATPWTVDHKAPLSMEFSRQEDWSGLPFPSPGDLPNPGIDPRSPALQVDSLLSKPPLSSLIQLNYIRNMWGVFLVLICKLLRSSHLITAFPTVLCLLIRTAFWNVKKKLKNLKKKSPDLFPQMADFYLLCFLPMRANISSSF